MKGGYPLVIGVCLLALAAPADADQKGPALEVSTFKNLDDKFSLNITATDDDGIKLVQYRYSSTYPWQSAFTGDCGRDPKKKYELKALITRLRVNEVEAEDCNGKKSYWRRIETGGNVSFEVDKPNATVTSVKTVNLQDADGNEPNAEDFEVKATSKRTRVISKKPFTKKNAKETGVAEVVVDPAGEDYYFTLEFLIDPSEGPALFPPLLALLAAILLAIGLLAVRRRAAARAR